MGSQRAQNGFMGMEVPPNFGEAYKGKLVDGKAEGDKRIE
jgi:hypothetical protein